MEPGLNDGEVVVQASRSAKMVNMIQKVIHKASPSLGHGCHMREASIQIPHGSFIAEDLKDAVAEDEQTRAGWDLAGLSWEIYPAKATHYQAGGRKKERIRLAKRQQNGGRVAAAGPGHRTVSTVVNTIPDCEESFAMMFSLEDVIELCQHLIGLV